jgi:coatomer protein complex subunit alpha (xenin)
LDIDLPVGDDTDNAADSSASGAGAGGEYFVFPSAGRSAISQWANHSTLAADQIAAGAFDQAMHLLHRQIGLVDFAPLKEGFLSIHNAAQAFLPNLAMLPPLATPLFRTSDGKESEFPNLAYKLAHVVEPLKSAYKNVTEGRFAAALKEFISVLHTLPLVVVDKRAEVAEVAELLGICREYVTAIRLEMARKESDADPIRATALAAYFTQCKLQTSHLILGLKSAIKSSFTVKNYIMTATFCRRILEICSSTSSASILAMVNVKQIKGVLQMCEKSNTDAEPIDFPESHFTLCCKTLTPIAKGQPVSKCPYCAATFQQQFDDQICTNCQLAKIGMQATGLRVFPE